jgi:hypothetical protein
MAQKPHYRFCFINRAKGLKTGSSASRLDQADPTHGDFDTRIRKAVNHKRFQSFADNQQAKIPYKANESIFIFHIARHQGFEWQSA